MADRPILFSSPMVRALLVGRKTQTRRIAKLPEPSAQIVEMVRVAFDAATGRPVYEMKDAYGRHANIRAGSHSVTPNFSPPHAIGDRLYVREAWRTHKSWDEYAPRNIIPCSPVWYEADAFEKNIGLDVGKLRPSLFLPLWASRLTLIVTDVRVQRLQDCSEEDAIAEGCVWSEEKRAFWVPGIEHSNPDFPYLTRPTASEMYAALWDHINGSGAWAKNPWVAATTFRVILGNIDQNEKR